MSKISEMLLEQTEALKTYKITIIETSELVYEIDAEDEDKAMNSLGDESLKSRKSLNWEPISIEELEKEEEENTDESKN